MWDGSSVFCLVHMDAIRQLARQYNLIWPIKMFFPENLTEDQRYGLLELGPCSACRYDWSISGTKDGIYFLQSNLRESGSKTPDRYQVHTSRESEQRGCDKESCTEPR